MINSAPLLSRLNRLRNAYDTAGWFSDKKRNAYKYQTMAVLNLFSTHKNQTILNK